jgi:uncharacterized membrane protein
MKSRLIFCLLFLSSFVNAKVVAEHILVDGKDSLIVSESSLELDDLSFVELLPFAANKKIYSEKPYAVVVFSDQDRRVLKKADRIKIVYNKTDSIEVKSIADIIFRNPGPDGLIDLEVFPTFQGEVLELENKSGMVRYTYLSIPPKEPLISDNKVVFGILLVILAFIFYTSGLENKSWKKIYTVIPALFLCYMIPGALTSLNVISPDVSGDLYYMSSRYLLPGSLILLILSVDLNALLGLGSKSLIMFFTGTFGIIIGGVFAVWIFSMFSPETVGGEGNEATWRGLATIAGSWIGGGANQAAMLETYKYKESLFGGMLIVDIVVANIWMAVILFGIGKKARIDRWLKADSSAIDDLVEKVENFQKSVQRKATLSDYMVIAGLVFGGVGLSHFLSGIFADFFLSSAGKTSTFASSFFWMVVLSTIYGLVLSFTRAKSYEGVGASKIGSVFLYILVATIGMKVDVSQIFHNPLLIFVGLVWMAFHAGLLILVAKIIRAPFFFLAVGSQANVGGAASAPIVANAFHPALTTVGVLMAVFGYFIGTFGAVLCAELMFRVAPI